MILILAENEHHPLRVQGRESCIIRRDFSLESKLVFEISGKLGAPFSLAHCQGPQHCEGGNVGDILPTFLISMGQFVADTIEDGEQFIAFIPIFQKLFSQLPDKRDPGITGVWFYLLVHITLHVPYDSLDVEKGTLDISFRLFLKE